MSQRFCAIRFVSTYLLATLAILVYSLLVVPGTLEYSHLGFSVLIGFIGIFCALTPMESLRTWGSLVLAALIMRIGLDSVATLGGIDGVIRGTVVVLLVLAVTRIYARAQIDQLLGVLLAAVILLSLAPGDEIRAYNRFLVGQTSDRLYTSPTFDYFPAERIIVDGEEGIAIPGAPRDADPVEDDGVAQGRVRVLRDEEIRLRFFAPEDGLLVERDVDISLLEGRGGHYPGIPYYHLGPGGVEAAISTPDLVENVLRLGNPPVLATEMMSEVIRRRLEASGGIYDSLRWGDDFEATLADGEISVETGGLPHTAPTSATRIVGPLQTADGEAIALLGRDLEVYGIQGEGLSRSHTLGADLVEDVELAEFVVADVTGDGLDELLMSSVHSPSRILRPAIGGSWELLWMAREDDPTFRFETVIPREGDTPEIVALSRSRVRAHPLRYLSGYRLENGTLVPTWRSMMALVDVRSLDVTGDGSPELVGTRFGEHRFWVLSDHRMPVTTALWIGVGLLLVLLAVARLRSGIGLSRARVLVLAASAAVVVISLTVGAVGYSGEYPSAEATGQLTPAPLLPGGCQIADTEISDVAGFVADAVRNTRSEEKFWYTGWIATHHGKRQVNAMFDGVVNLPGGYVSNVRVNANPLRFFRWDDSLYAEERGLWHDEGEARVSLDPFADFGWLETIAPDLESRGTGSVLGLPALVFSADLGMDEWLQAAGADPVETLAINGGGVPGAVSVEVRIDPEEGRLVEYTVEVRAPLPGVGWYKQETFFRFYRFDDPSIGPVPVDEILEHIRRSPLE